MVRYITEVVLRPGSLLAGEHLVQCRPIPGVSSVHGGFNSNIGGGERRGYVWWWWCAEAYDFFQSQAQELIVE